MYDPNILLELDFHKSPAKFNPFISAAAPGNFLYFLKIFKNLNFNLNKFHR